MQESLFTVAKLEDFVSADYPLRPLRELVNEALKRRNGLFNLIYADTGRASIAPETLIQAVASHADGMAKRAQVLRLLERTGTAAEDGGCGQGVRHARFRGRLPCAQCHAARGAHGRRSAALVHGGACAGVSGGQPAGGLMCCACEPQLQAYSR